MLISETLDKASRIMLDVARKRTKLGELVDYFNEAVTVIVTRRPDAAMPRVDFALTPGWRQELPLTLVPAPVRIVDVLANTAGRGVRVVDRTALDASHPQWRRDTQAGVIVNVVLDGRNPLAFDTWPPAAAGASLEVMYQCVPAPVALANAATAVYPIGVQFEPLVLDYIIARCADKETGDPQNAALAAKHRALFEQGIAGKTAVDGAVTPTATKD
jgi:hypothetical protein